MKEVEIIFEVYRKNNFDEHNVDYHYVIKRDEINYFLNLKEESFLKDTFENAKKLNLDLSNSNCKLSDYIWINFNEYEKDYRIEKIYDNFIFSSEITHEYYVFDNIINHYFNSKYILFDNKNCINKFWRHFGLPIYIGFDFNNKNIIKLISKEYFSSSFIINFIKDELSFSFIDVNHKKSIFFILNNKKSYRISLDIDIKNDKFIPRLSLEILNENFEELQNNLKYINFINEYDSDIDHQIIKNNKILKIKRNLSNILPYNFYELKNSWKKSHIKIILNPDGFFIKHYFSLKYAKDFREQNKKYLIKHTK